LSELSKKEKGVHFYATPCSLLMFTGCGGVGGWESSVVGGIGIIPSVIVRSGLGGGGGG